MSRLIHQEKQEGTIGKEEIPIARGKVLYVTKQEAESLGLQTSIFEGTDFDDVEIRSFKEDLIKVLKEQNFVFFDNPVYRLKLNQRNRIVEFGVSFCHIK